jgi:hypothetical protein
VSVFSLGDPAGPAERGPYVRSKRSAGAPMVQSRAVSARDSTAHLIRGAYHRPAAPCGGRPRSWIGVNVRGQTDRD